MRVEFTVEQAGCESCGKLIAEALSQVGSVESIEIDEAADTAAVVLSGSPVREAVDASLVEASAGAGHVYSVQAGSWLCFDID